MEAMQDASPTNFAWRKQDKRRFDGADAPACTAAALPSSGSTTSAAVLERLNFETLKAEVATHRRAREAAEAAARDTITAQANTIHELRCALAFSHEAVAFWKGVAEGLKSAEKQA